MKTRKIAYHILGLAVAALLLYHSVYFTSLSEHKAMMAELVFDPTRAVEAFWKEAPAEMQEKALDLATFDRQLHENAQQLAQQQGNTLGIGAPYSILIKGKAEVERVEDETAILRFDSDVTYVIRTGYIFSNTVREASGYFDLDRFETMMDFNLVALEINSRIVSTVIEPIKPQLVPGSTVEFLGAVDIDLRRIPTTSVEIIPVQLQCLQP